MSGSLNGHGPFAASARGPNWVAEFVLRVAGLGRQRASSEVPAVGGAQQVEAPPSEAAPSAQSGGGAPDHLLVLVNGLFGSRANWEVMQGLIAAQLGSGALLHASESNEFAQVRLAAVGGSRRASTGSRRAASPAALLCSLQALLPDAPALSLPAPQTFQGIDVCGERLASEIRGLRGAHPSLKSISFVAHSMGGLLSRYAIGRLYDPGTQTVAGLEPRHFVAIATPHLGCDAERSPAQVPFIGWVGALPSVGLRAQALLGSLAAPFSSIAFARTGRQFFLADAAAGEAEAPLLARMTADEPEEVRALRFARCPRTTNQQSMGGRPVVTGCAAGWQLLTLARLLLLLAAAARVQGLLFMSGLAAFATRTLYANSSGDHLVGWGNSSLRSLHQLPTRSSAK